MEGNALQDAAQACAEGLPAAGLEFPFGPEYEVFKVCGKVFMLMTEVPGRPVVILKSDPQDAEALRETYADISPGYHMNKRHWITLAPGESIDEKLVEELVTESYRLVVDKMPASARPLAVENFGATGRAAS